MEKQQEERTPITNTAPYKISDKCQTLLKKYNVVLFKNCLDKKGQKQLLRDCGDIMEIGKNPNLLERTKFKNYSKKAVPILFWNWPAVKESLSYPEIYRPASLLALSTTLFDLARSKVQEDQHSVRVHYANSKGMAFPAEYSPNALYGILYPHGGSFIPHVDGAKQWALAISVGESARFFVCETECGPREYIQIDSGDAIIFKGGVLYHGVESIIPNSAPKFWYKEESKFRVFDMARFNLQFRDPKNDRLEYYPCFKEIDRGAMPFSK